MEPTTQEIIAHLSEHYGITKSRVVSLLRIPTHPATMRDDIAMAAATGILGGRAQNDLEWVADRAYLFADKMLKRRFEGSRNQKEHG